MEKEIVIHKTYKNEEMRIMVDVTIEEISNGFLMTKTTHKYSEKDYGSPKNEGEGYKCVKTYFKENPIGKKTPLWDIVNFDEE